MLCGSLEESFTDSRKDAYELALEGLLPRALGHFHTSKAWLIFGLDGLARLHPETGWGLDSRGSGGQLTIWSLDGDAVAERKVRQA